VVDEASAKEANGVPKPVMENQPGIPAAEPTTKAVKERNCTLSFLPNFTKDEVRNVHSPQHKALNSCVDNEPCMGNCSSVRTSQRFALACLCYSTNGEGWTSSKN